MEIVIKLGYAHAGLTPAHKGNVPCNKRHQSNRTIDGGKKTMKNIKSLKIAAQAFTLKNLIQLYQLCHSGSHELYIYSKKTMCKIRDLIELETFRMVHKENEYLIVIEGKKADHMIEKFQGLIEPAEKQVH